MSGSGYYQVVGVRADKSRVVICKGLTSKQADRIKVLLHNESVFSSVEIEPDAPSFPELDLSPDDGSG